MPWHKKTMKDVAACVKPRIAGNKRFNPGISEWGNPSPVMWTYSLAEFIGLRGQGRRTETS